MSEQLPLTARPRLGPKPRLGYTASPLERAADMRAEALITLLSQEDARVYVVSGEMIVLNKGEEFHDPLFRIGDAQEIGQASETVFVGLHGSAPRFGMALEPAVAEDLKQRDAFVVTDLRSIAVNAMVEPEHLSALAEAKALLTWHRRHRFCPNCGAPSMVVEGGWRRDCAACNTQHFPRTDPVVIMLPFSGDQCVLGRSYRFIPDMWSCLAGFVEPGETIEQAVRRETREEAGIVSGRVNYFASQPWPFPTSLMIGCHAEATSREIVVDKAELEDARWFSKDEIVMMLMRKHPNGLTTPPPMAIAHHIIRAWVEDEVSFD
jgi:NAD+ diphosphatase